MNIFKSVLIDKNNRSVAILIKGKRALVKNSLCPATEKIYISNLEEEIKVNHKELYVQY